MYILIFNDLVFKMSLFISLKQNHSEAMHSSTTLPGEGKL